MDQSPDALSLIGMGIFPFVPADGNGSKKLNVCRGVLRVSAVNNVLVREAGDAIMRSVLASRAKEICTSIIVCIVYCIIVFLIVFIYFTIDLVIAVIIHVFVIVERRLRKSSSGSINRLIICKPPLVPLRY